MSLLLGMVGASIVPPGATGIPPGMPSQATNGPPKSWSEGKCSPKSCFMLLYALPHSLLFGIFFFRATGECGCPI